MALTGKLAKSIRATSSSDANNNVVYEGQNSGSQNSEDGSTNYFVNGGDPVDASATQTNVDNGENKKFKIPGGEEDSDDSKNVVIPTQMLETWKNSEIVHFQVNSQSQYEQPAYILQPASSGSSSDANTNVVYEGQNSGSQNSEDGSTNYFVNGGDPVDASATQTKVDDGENKEFKVPGGEEDSDDSKNVVIPKKEHVRFIPYQPPVVIRDKKGNIYERRVENGKVHYIDASGNEVKIDNSKIDQKIERILENRRRQEEASLRSLIGNSGDSESDPITAAEAGRQG
ncbi:hypothetical protein B9Z55_000821 [Caenorhabditis nigoni]|uniref:Uncharacterized protein n=1 Tax=Caenorhabditis nigoni TaxID=1611254 RepID=A0A2G5VVD8_9PELO|nr:hypothetical protein B9Z55_000821 [Caenorhabditis nigoni]